MTETPENIAQTAAAIAAGMGFAAAVVAHGEGMLDDVADTSDISDTNREPDDYAVNAAGGPQEPGGVETPPDAVVKPYNPTQQPYDPVGGPGVSPNPGSSPLEPAPDPNHTGANQAP
jgi:hypothetical protein